MSNAELLKDNAQLVQENTQLRIKLHDYEKVMKECAAPLSVDKHEMNAMGESIAKMKKEHADTYIEISMDWADRMIQAENIIKKYKDKA